MSWVNIPWYTQFFQFVESHFIISEFPWIISLNVWVFFHSLCFSPRTQLYVSGMSFSCLLCPLFPSLFLSWLFASRFFQLCLHSVIIYSLHFSSSFIFSTYSPPHFSSVFFSFFFVVFIHQGNCFIEYTFILIHSELSGWDFHLLGSVLHLPGSFAALSHVFFQ